MRIRTYTGLSLDLAAPQTEQICIEDIVQGLSHTCRFTGQLDDFYSVLQHSMLVASLVDEPFVWPALHHDDTEAYMCDLSRNLKHSGNLVGYVQLETQLADVIADKFDCWMSPVAKRAVKAADDLAAVFEHWMLRKKLPWDAEAAIHWAFMSGFINTRSPEELLRIAPRLPNVFVPLSPQQVRYIFWPLYRGLMRLRFTEETKIR